MTHLLKENDNNDFKTGVELIKQGGTVAFRTETVYGLGASAINDDAVKRIFIAKSRPQTNPLIVHFYSLAHLQEYLKVPTEILPLFKIKGALTVVLPLDFAGDKRISQVVLAGQKTVACRIPSCPFTQKLIRACGVPIAAPSANTSTRPSPTRWQDVYDDLNKRIDAIFIGKQTNIGLESTVVLYNNKKLEILRQGGILARKLSKITKLPVEIIQHENSKLAKSPGTQFKHYSPSAPLEVITETLTIESLKSKHTVILCRNQNKKLYKNLTCETTQVITLGNSAKQIQSNLFAAFREAEKLLNKMNEHSQDLIKPEQLIFIEQMPNTDAFATINERITKASTR